MKNIIIVNATALDDSGALTILRQFIEAVPSDEKFLYMIFVSNKISLNHSQSNIRLIPMAVKSFRKRFLWDAFGLKRWLRTNKIRPAATISLQNTNFRVDGDIPNYVYYHQSIPFFDHQWSLFKPQERQLWFYKHIYPFFVNLFLNDRTQVFVQLDFIKSGFVKKIKFAEEKIHVITPKIELFAKDKIIEIETDANKINLFYPATPFFYKNHKIIFDALVELKSDTFVLYLTCEKSDLIEYPEEIDIRFMGKIPFAKVLGMYAKADALIFPSYIETYGLPLIEAASFGMPVLAADLPYAREVLAGYKGVTYVDYKDPDAWAEQIAKLEKGKKYDSYDMPDKKSWQELFRIITQNTL